MIHAIQILEIARDNARSNLVPHALSADWIQVDLDNQIIRQCTQAISILEGQRDPQQGLHQTEDSADTPVIVGH